MVKSYGMDIISYADDTQLLVTCRQEDLLDAQNRFKNCMVKIFEWMTTNKLQLNCSKTEIILFGKAKQFWSGDWWPSELGNCPTAKASVRNLGIAIDDTLSMKTQVNQVAGTCYGILRRLRKIFKWLPIDSRKPLVQGLIIGRLDYGNALLAAINQDLLSRLQTVQNIAARLVLNRPIRSSSLPILRELHWLPVRQRIQFKILTLTHKVLNGEGPEYLAEKLHRYVPARSLRSSTNSLLSQPRMRTVRNGSRTFTHFAPMQWNKLPLELRSTTNLLCFRQKLKTWLFPS